MELVEYDGKRMFFLNADFRRDPKTNCFCAVCQKDLKGKFVTAQMDDDGLGQHLVHKDDLDGTEFKVFLGLDCVKKKKNTSRIYILGLSKHQQ